MTASVSHLLLNGLSFVLVVLTASLVIRANRDSAGFRWRDPRFWVLLAISTGLGALVDGYWIPLGAIGVGLVAALQSRKRFDFPHQGTTKP